MNWESNPTAYWGLNPGLQHGKRVYLPLHYSGFPYVCFFSQMAASIKAALKIRQTIRTGKTSIVKDEQLSQLLSKNNS